MSRRVGTALFIASATALAVLAALVIHSQTGAVKDPRPAVFDQRGAGQ
jgi:hypothetical protein